MKIKLVNFRCFLWSIYRYCMFGHNCN